MTRYFHLTAGQDPEQAIRSVEARGHAVVKTVLLAADSVPVYGKCEVSAPAMSLPEPASESGEACLAGGVKLPEDRGDLCNGCWSERKPACACDLLSCAECVSRSPFHHADPDKCICSSVPGRCPAYGFGFCACLCHGGVVKENRQGAPKDDRERGVEVTGGALSERKFSRSGVAD